MPASDPNGKAQRLAEADGSRRFGRRRKQQPEEVARGVDRRSGPSSFGVVPERVERTALARGIVGGDLTLTVPGQRAGTALDIDVSLTKWPVAFEADERQLLAQLTAGATNQEIAERLGISRAVTRQLTRIYDKLGVRGRQETVQQLRGLARSRE